ncbi:MAG: hypothetical protein II267_04235 [Paludibacteraceae bacterium]|nr:hypothetical protein [Paludibacteraceae bacterium]
MNRRLFILGLILFNLCALQAAQRWEVTWKVNGIAMTTSNVKDGYKPTKANIPGNPNINCEKEFVGWTVEESYNNNLKPSDLFNNSNLITNSPVITTSITFHAVFVGEDSVYTTENCFEDLQFIPNDTVVSLKDAQQGKILFIRNKDARIEHIYGGDGNFDVSCLNFTDSGTYLTLNFPGEYWVKVTTKPDWRYREYDKHLVQFEIRDDSRTIKYYGFDDNWCIDAISQGGIKNVGDTFIISTQVPSDPDDLGRQFVNWNTSDLRELGKSYKIGDTILVKDDITLYPQWVWEITNDIIAPEYDIPNTDIIIKAGNTFSISSGEWYEAHILTLEGGLNSANPPYAMPSLYIEEGGEFYKYNPDNIVHFDLSINKDNYYPFAVPFPVLVSDIDYADPALAAASTYGTHYVIKRYDGALRAENGINNETNWKIVNESETLQPGVGYIITAVPVGGKAVIRIPLEFSDYWTIDGEQSDIGDGIDRSQINTIAHSGAAATAEPIHAGWNFIANPYLAKYDGNNITNAPAYANIPRYDFSAYDQVPLNTATLSPEYPFFVQVGSDATLNFATTGRRQAPASLRSTPNTTLQATLSITPQDDQTADHTTILINDTYTPAYEINADLEKMFGSAYTTALYTLSLEHRLAYNALSPQDALTPIPLGFRAAQEGEYTITLDNPNDLDNIESVNLFDAHTNQTINLLHFDYTFTTTRTQDDARFTVNFVSRSNTATNITDIPSPTTSTTKFIHNNQLYILKHGNIYNAQGQQIQ